MYMYIYITLLIKHHETPWLNLADSPHGGVSQKGPALHHGGSGTGEQHTGEDEDLHGESWQHCQGASDSGLILANDC